MYLYKSCNVKAAEIERERKGQRGRTDTTIMVRASGNSLFMRCCGIEHLRIDIDTQGYRGRYKDKTQYSKNKAVEETSTKKETTGNNDDHASDADAEALAGL